MITTERMLELALLSLVDRVAIECRVHKEFTRDAHDLLKDIHDIHVLLIETRAKM